MKILIVTDAWYPQINGVVRTITRTCEELRRMGHTIDVIGPDRFHTLPCPTYPEIRLSLFPSRKLHRFIEDMKPDAIHISTEGPLGLSARAWCLRNKFPFTTTFHTQFPEYVWLRTRIPLSVSYRFMRWFHSPAVVTMVATQTLHERLSHWGFKNLGMWSRGVNIELFRPGDKDYLNVKRPLFMYMGRVAIEKNIEAFLKLSLPGTKYVVGGGPHLEMLRRKYPDAVFTGAKEDADLARHVAAADVFVFPSVTDTFGLVLIEALACGVPVAAFPVQGPVDVIENGVTGYLNDDLRQAALDTLTLNSARCREEALKYTWEACTRQFLNHLELTRSTANTKPLPARRAEA
jgi:glycosyltransferase involved in cell wall biosynthesis